MQPEMAKEKGKTRDSDSEADDTESDSTTDTETSEESSEEEEESEEEETMTEKTLEAEEKIQERDGLPPYDKAKRNPKAKWYQSPKALEDIEGATKAAVEVIPFWRRNLFTIPSGALGKKIASILTDLIRKWTAKTEWECLGLDLATIFLPLILQRSGRKVAAKEAKQTIARRLEQWSRGELEALIEEGQKLQDRLPKTQLQTTPEHAAKVFARLIMQGKVHSALRLLSDVGNGGVAKPSPTILEKLKEKHPEASPQFPEALLAGIFRQVPSSIFDELNGALIQEVAMRSRGSAGPFGPDAADIRNLLCSKCLGNSSVELCEAVAETGRRLCTEFVDPNPLSAFLSCRLVPLEKGKEDIRPIGIGETLRRVVGKAVTRVLKPEIQKACGNLQVCAGLDSGCEAAIHSMKDLFEEDDNEAALLVDASNAFNAANRSVALHNISIICPAFFPFLCNTYRVKVRLFVPAWRKEIASNEGTTQGDPAAMPMYALSVVPLIQKGQHLVRPQNNGGQVWYADDGTGVSKLENLRHWWDFLKEKGPLYGYFPKAAKTVLVVKEGYQQKANELFGTTGIKMELKGARHLGGALGNQSFREAFAEEKVRQLMEELSALCKYAETQPQAAYAAYTHGFQSKWTFLQRVIPGTSDLFLPLEEKIHHELLPRIIGKTANDTERAVFALPARLGGMGIQNPVEKADENYDASRSITSTLAKLIVAQEADSDLLDEAELEKSKSRVVAKKRALEKKAKQDLLRKLEPPAEVPQPTKRKKKKPPDPMTKALEVSSQKGTSGWLTSMPDQTHALNKQEWRDSIALRYGWRPKNFPQRCSCGAENSVQHALDCKLGGFIHMRHNRLRDLFADLLKRAGCKAIQVEQQLLPDEGELKDAPKKVERGDEARMDVVATGFWGAWQRAYFDVRVFNPFAQSHVTQNLEAVAKKQEKEKKDKYGLRILEIEKGTFTPLVFTTAGGCGKECNMALKRLCNLISEKTGNNQSSVMNCIRTEINFSLLRACHMCLRGHRNHKADRTAKFREETDYEVTESILKLK